MAVEEKRMRQIRDTSTAWANENPTLLDGELGIETDTGSIKVGDGATAWNALPYIVRPPILDNLTASSPPTPIDDSTRGYSLGSRWWDSFAAWYTCTDASVGAAVWVILDRQLPIAAGFDVSLGFIGGAVPSSAGYLDHEPLARAWRLPQNAVGTVAGLDGVGHTAPAIVDVFARRAAWTTPATPRRLFTVTFAAGADVGTLSNLDADLAAGDLDFAADDRLYLVDAGASSLGDTSARARVVLSGVAR